MDTLKIHFSGQGISEEHIGKILSNFSLRSYQKGDYFVEEGKRSHHLGLLLEGAFQFFVLSNGEEKTTYVATPPAFVTSLASFINQLPAEEYIRCIADAQVWVISYTDLKKLILDIPSFKDFYIRLLEHQIKCVDESRINFIKFTAEERYEKMLSSEPHLLHQIPLQYLASILGVTPRHLSRIRNKIR
ncbi:MAG: Crp/Fnr family transcriptional regulator [Microscillaceae bacterium]|nr:Crp/Fnr family transcriptional regulator [Microscillaceae bacterium]